VGLSISLVGSSAYGVSLQLVSSSSNITVGQMVDIAVVVSDLGNQTAPSLSFYDLDINFDASLLGFQTVSFGDPLLGNQLDLNGLGTGPGSILGVGFVSISEGSGDSETDLDTQQLGSFTLATLSFQGIGVGNSPLSLTVTELLNSQVDPLTVNSLTGTSINITPAITQTPESPLNVGVLGLVILAGIAVLKPSSF
jgi:hypothetical protein